MPPKNQKKKAEVVDGLKPASTLNKDDDEPLKTTRATRGRQANNSVSKDDKPTKKIKKDESEDESLKKSKSEPKKTRSKDLSASKDNAPVK